MEFVIQPWHWFCIGYLILSELILPAFAALWFGIAAIMVCFLYWLFPDISLTTQIVLDSSVSAMHHSFGSNLLNHYQLIRLKRDYRVKRLLVKLVW